MFKDILEVLESQVTIDDKYKALVPGNESAKFLPGEEISALEEDLSSMVESALVSANESLELNITKKQIDVAKESIKYAIDPVKTLQSIAKEGRKAPNDTNVIPLFASDVIEDKGLVQGIESFDHTDIQKTAYFTVLYNSLAVVTDPVVDAFYPIFAIGTDEAGASIKTRVIQIIDSVQKDITGRPVEYTRHNLVKEANNTDLFTLDANRLYPVVRDETADLLLADITGATKTVEVLDGVEITTAPIKTNVEVNILRLAQSDALLAKGYVDETDTLDSAIFVDSLVFKVTGKDGSNDVTEYYKRELSGILPTFMPTQQGNTQTLYLNSDVRLVTFKGGNITKIDGNATAIDTLENLPEGYEVVIALKLNGDADVRSGNLNVAPRMLKLLAVKNAAGEIIPETDTLYTSIKTIVDSMEVVGAVIEAYASNVNARYAGKRIDYNDYKYYYTVNVRSKWRELIPVVDNGRGSTALADSNPLIGAIFATRRSLAKHGLLELNRSASAIQYSDEAAENFGISSNLVNRYFHEETLDIRTIVNTIKSSEKQEDVKAALRIKLNRLAMKMWSESNYNFAFTAFNAGQKPTVIIGADYRLGTYLGDWEDENFKYKVAVSPDSLMTGKLFMSFGGLGNGREINPLNFGVCVWRSELVFTIQRTMNGATYAETQVMPAFRHQTILPVLTYLAVEGIEEIGDVTPVYMKQL